MEIVKAARMLHVDTVDRNKGLAELQKTVRKLNRTIRQSLTIRRSPQK